MEALGPEMVLVGHPRHARAGAVGQAAAGISGPVGTTQRLWIDPARVRVFDATRALRWRRRLMTRGGCRDVTWLGAAKPIIAMVHLPPLPGSPLYDAAGGMAAIVDHAARDIEALQAGGIDAVMFGNEGDRPYG